MIIINETAQYLRTKKKILMTVQENEVILVCVCSHDYYDRRNKDC